MLENPPHKSENRSITEATFVAAVAAVPAVGGPLASAFTSRFHREHEEKMQRWYESVAKSINRMEGKLSDPYGDPEFRDALISASRIAETTSREGKLEMLRAAVVNSAFPTRPSEEKRIRFLRLIEQMVPEHVSLLSAEHMEIGNSLTNFFAFSPERDADMEYRLLADLEGWGLAKFTEKSPDSARQVWEGERTPLGEEFLLFVRDQGESKTTRD